MSGQYPKARWRGPVPNMTPSGMVMPPIGVVLHIQEGNENGTDAWMHNPSAQVSAHFGAPMAGGIDQWVMVGDKAWHAVDANSHYVGIECEGNSGDKLTTDQAESIAELLAWLHQAYKIPLVICSTPGAPGLAYHALGGTSWGGHPDCPGQPIISARPALLARAAELVGAAPPVSVDGTPAVIHLQTLLNSNGAAPQLLVDGIRGAHTNTAYVTYMHGRNLVETNTGTDVEILQAMLAAHGYGLAVDGDDGPDTTGCVREFQKARGLAQDGQAGAKTNAALGS